ncbi:stage IV sporulation protein FB [Sediminibacillus albus]|uniref:Stage IV sporulation protein FB n=2 Tax=Sediminibacillus albus TaxID=407036 RepID=A0A1G9BNF2_9BACI|nr:stage IV sporulation protein FB [Sediminibacillus albus]
MFPQLHIHPVLWFFAVTAVITGMLVEFVVIFLIVFIHELGHFAAARKFGWRIRRISLWVFGGVMETEEHSTKPMREEAWIIASGPLQHIWIYLLLLMFSKFEVLPQAVIQLGYLYNTTILLFNLLPIWPLDGGRIYFLMLSRFLPFRKAHSVTIISSIIFSAIGVFSFLIFYPFTLSTVMLAGFIIWENRLEWKQRYYIFIRFLVKRYMAKQNKLKVRPLVVAPDTRLIDVFSKFKRAETHHIFVKQAGRTEGWMDEKVCLYAYFKINQYQASAGEIMHSDE